MTPPDRTCVRDGEIVCCDDLCHGVSQTICGLWEGIDFDVDGYDEWDAEEEEDHREPPTAVASPSDA